MNFTAEIINWYAVNKRDLPWRKTSDPYIIWLSEVILQQTRVEQGTPYFYNFSEKYPTVADFAAASEDDILKLWQGLGYYSRGRNMHHTANMVMDRHAGSFPNSYNELIGLKGIGEYTAAAISSFSANEVRAVVDGNVFRLLARYFGIDTPINSPKGKKEFTELANQLIDRSQPGTCNQAIMEFGSQQCRPKNPLCGTCPLRPGCVAYKLNRINELPVKLKSLKVKERYFNYLVIVKTGQLLMNKRGPNDIWQNLYDLPLIETKEMLPAEEITGTPEFTSQFGNHARIKAVSQPVKHLLSHQKLYTQFIEVADTEDLFGKNGSLSYVPLEETEQLAQPKLIFTFLKNFIT